MARPQTEIIRLRTVRMEALKKGTFMLGMITVEAKKRAIWKGQGGAEKGVGDFFYQPESREIRFRGARTGDQISVVNPHRIPGP